ncbi:hypothetical protein BZG35_08340 [Brevundimonas sp. LM2]|uniref:hypothetical protein n=1 Tax=Brevundimonas sp. LM2 TaxID=1938605 RepID=UPI000983C2D9|nr:hypothetical protein [Brevundimonas sp. LM2]AQR61658.1 hypothetical protein BZG35_08340 [Brevundimonas sp. LM2]
MGFVNTLQIGLTGISCLILILLVWQGRGAERLAALALTMLMFGSPLVDTEFRPGMVLLSTTALVWLAWLSLAHDRWWLILAVALQGLVVATHLLPFLEPETRVWGAVTVRLALWVALMLIAVLGVAEARWAPYARRLRPLS